MSPERWQTSMELIAALRSDLMKENQIDANETWLVVTGVVIECIVLGWLLLSEKLSH